MFCRNKYNYSVRFNLLCVFVSILTFIGSPTFPHNRKARYFFLKMFLFCYNLFLTPLLPQPQVKKDPHGFKFGTFVGRFPSDSAASMAVKGLTLEASSVFHSKV